MIIENDNNKLPRNRKTRTEQKIRKDDKMKTLLKKIEQKKKKNKIVDEIKDLEIELVKIKYANNPNKLQSELKELNKIQVVIKNLHENKPVILLDYDGEFELNGSSKGGDQIRQIHIRFRIFPIMKLI